jgi:hypothetical protein
VDIRNRSLQATIRTLVAIVWLGTPLSARAQVLYGSITGTVRDGSGATVRGATVAATHMETGLRQTTTSNDTGAYTVPNVQPGSYEVTVTLEGFKVFVTIGVPVTVGQVARVDVDLHVGAVTETMTVTAESRLLQTDNADINAEFKGWELTNTPLADYRNYQSLLNQVPGATPAGSTNAITDTPARALATNINGTNRNNNNTRIDGAASVFIWLPHSTAYVSPVETIDTVKVTTNAFDAEQGMAGGAAITVFTKSGTNDFRGSGFYFRDGDELQARWGFLPANQPKPESSRTMAGGTLGGPLVRNRLFFFGAFEGTYERVGFSRIYTVPTMALRRGDFSGVDTIIYDPSTGNPDGTGRVPFPRNQIPQDRLSQSAQRLLALLPAPNQTGGDSNNYSASGVQRMDRPNYDLKVNWNRSVSHQIWGKYSLMDAKVFGEPGLGEAGGLCLCSGGVGTGLTKVHVGTFGTTWISSERFVVDGSFGTTRMNQAVTGLDSDQTLDQLGIPGTTGHDPRYGGLPVFAFGAGYSHIGNVDTWLPLFRNDRSYTAGVNVTTLTGRHELRYGYDLVRHELNHWQPEIGGGPRGRFDFSGGITALNGGRAPDQFNALADFLLGLPRQAGKTIQHELMTGREWQHGGYVRDRWTVSDKLTLSLGMRYEYYPLMSRADRGLEVLDLTRTLPFPGAARPQPLLLLGGLGGLPDDLGIETSRRLFAPRLGAAYRIDDDTVFRAGWGRAFNPLPWSRPLRGFYPLTVGASFVGPNAFQPFQRLEQGIPPIAGPDLSTGGIPLDPRAQMRTPEPDNVKRGHIDSWNITLERRIPWDVIVTTAYVGTRTRNGYADLELNAGEPGTSTSGAPLALRFGRTSSTLSWGARTRADYHALQLSAHRPFIDGLLLRAAYTWSKAMNETDDDGWAGLLFNAPSQLHRNYALAGYDRTHVLQAGVMFAPPFGQSGRGVVSAIIKDWQVNGSLSAYSGRPFTVAASRASLNVLFGTQTADLVARPVKTGIKKPFQPFYEPESWAAVTQPRFGNSGRNSIRGPGTFNVDMSAFRSFPIGAHVRVQARLEIFNVFNIVHFDPPGFRGGLRLDTASTDFMHLVDGPRDQRQARIGLRVTF